MTAGLSVMMITKNAGLFLRRSLESVSGLADDIVLVDDHSNDNTLEVAKSFHCRIYSHTQTSYGEQRSYGLSKCSGKWILMIDADEVLTEEVQKEIKQVLESKEAGIDGYHIYFQNHFLGHKLSHGGELYTKLALFKKDKAKIVSGTIHEHAEVAGKTCTLHGKIMHYSYQSVPQLFSKFTRYGEREALRKRQNGERSSLVKLVTYPTHLFYARYIKDKGYKDHPSRILLDAAFAYMEFLTYFLLLFPQQKSKKT